MNVERREFIAVQAELTTASSKILKKNLKLTIAW